jgi:hypothetical protein
MAAGLVEVGGVERHYHFFDSFEGLPAAKEIDGHAALRYQSSPGHPLYHDNCRASYEEFIDLMSRLRAPNIHAYKGWSEETLSGFPHQPIAVLRLDADFYESTRVCLERLWPCVIPGGLILIDDYYSFEGCSRAVHDFLSSIKAGEQVRQTGLGGVAHVRKL